MRELVLFAALTRAREAGRRDAARPARSAWSVQRPLAARFDGEVAGGAVAIFVLVNLGWGDDGARAVGAIDDDDDDDDVGFGDGGVAGSLSEVQRPTGSSTAIAKFRSTDMGRGSCARADPHRSPPGPGDSRSWRSREFRSKSDMANTPGVSRRSPGPGVRRKNAERACRKLVREHRVRQMGAFSGSLIVARAAADRSRLEVSIFALRCCCP